MWCRDCQQDVPGVATSEAGKYACPRCGELLSAETAPAAKPAQPGQTPSPAGESPPTPGSRSAAEPIGTCSCGKACSCGNDTQDVIFQPIASPVPEPPLADNWEIGEQLRHIERVLRIDKSGRQPPAEKEGRRLRLDAAHTEHPQRHKPPKGKKSRRKASAGRGSWLGALAWTMLSLGSMALACGGVLLAWSAATGRDDLWTLGTPIVLVGQLVLLAGFILQLDRLWQNSREASAKLEHVDRRLAELKTTTSLLGTTHSTPAASFYSHMAGGANPELLLADLKGQLDLLAVKISRIDR